MPIESRSETIIGETRAAEIGTIVHDGREYSAGGFDIDMERGRMVAYVTRKPGALYTLQPYELTTWAGEHIAPLTRTGSARGFNRTRLECYITARPVAGFYWYGRGLGAGMVLKLRRGRKAVR